MTDGDAEADALGRLEAALDRISASAQRPSGPAIDTGAIGARLDRLMGQIRDALSADAAAGEA